MFHFASGCLRAALWRCGAVKSNIPREGFRSWRRWLTSRDMSDCHLRDLIKRGYIGETASDEVEGEATSGKRGF
jgi:hypothetical protein